ncbi:helix-turn-helix transcriptional regulator [Streptomyces violascens]|uniref:helix-turn-helix transcriptional regulator n=1 Tax=Streptomyces violascens TaxID=67381 RepID=UPI0036580FB6
MGMTRLLGAALRQAEAQGHTVFSVGGIGGVGASAGVAFDTFDTVLERLRRARRAEGSLPPVLGIDDAHLLDTAAATQLVSLAASRRVSVIAAVTREISPPVGIDILWLERHVERIDLTRFDRATLARVLRARLGGDVGATTLQRLWAVTRGHPLLLRELTEQSVSDDLLRRSGGVWRWSGLPGTLPRRLADVVLLRLRDLSVDEYELACLLAVAEPLEADLILQFGLSGAAESLHLRGLVSEERAGRRVQLRLSEPLSGYVLGSRMSNLTARRLRRQAADALISTGARREDDLLRIVTLRMDAGLVPAGEQLLGAALIALRQGDQLTAERLCRAALSDADAGGAESVRVRLLLARVLAVTGRHEEAEQEFVAASDAPQRLPQDEYLDALRARIDNLVWGMRRPDEAAALTDRAMRGLDGPSVRLLETCRAALALYCDRLPDAVAIASKVMDLEPVGSAAVRAVLPLAAFALLELGDPAGAMELLRAHGGSLEDLPEEARRDWDPVLAKCLFHLGDRDSTDAILTEAESDMGTDSRERSRHFHVSVLRACLYRKQGKPTEAVALLREAGTFAGFHGWLDTRVWTVGWLAGVLAETGQHSEALGTLLEAESERDDGQSYPILEDGIAFERALVLAHAGDVSGAVAQATEVAKRATAAGRVLTAAEALHLVARIADAAPLARRAWRLAEGSTSQFVRLQAEHIAALAAADGDALWAVAEQFLSVGAQPLAAEALAQAGRAHQAAGQLRSSQAAWARCQELLAGTGGSLPPWAAREAPSEHPVATLTTREREVAVVVAAGLSNREIAAQLFVSVRTVENHLHRIFNKLGISARADVARLLAEQDGDRRVA